MYTKHLLKSSIILCLTLALSCDLIQIKNSGTEEEQTKSQPIARVNQTFLYPEDLQSIVPAGVSDADSIDMIKRYINSWGKKQLMIDQAAATIDFDEIEIERKILDYRYALMVYEFEKDYVSRQLSIEITNQEVEDYYNSNQDNFQLKQNIIRGIYMKFAKEVPGLENIRNLVLSSKDEDREELKSYCLRFANNYSLEDSVWITFDEIITNTPMIGVMNRVDFLKRNKYAESEDDDYKYFLRIDEYKISDQISPLEFVEDQIKNIIINRRKVLLANNLEEEIFNKAIQNNDFEIY